MSLLVHDQVYQLGAPYPLWVTPLEDRPDLGEVDLDVLDDPRIERWRVDQEPPGRVDPLTPPRIYSQIISAMASRAAES